MLIAGVFCLSHNVFSFTKIQVRSFEPLHSQLLLIAVLEKVYFSHVIKSHCPECYGLYSIADVEKLLAASIFSIFRSV